MKSLKKKLKKKTVEAYACPYCGDPSACIMYCSSDIQRLNTGAGVYGFMTAETA